MIRNPVVSSHLDSIGYDPNTKTLEIEFKDGAVYQYFSVPERVYRNLVQAFSIGEYFDAHVRNSYSYMKI